MNIAVGLGFEPQSDLAFFSAKIITIHILGCSIQYRYARFGIYWICKRREYRYISEVSQRTDSVPTTFNGGVNSDEEVSCEFLMSQRDQLWCSSRTNLIKIRRFVLKAELTLPLNVVGTLSVSMRNLPIDHYPPRMLEGQFILLLPLTIDSLTTDLNLSFV
jgi:hypothetical protein